MEALVGNLGRLRWRLVLSAKSPFLSACRGCVSGKQLENLRDDIRQGDSYDFDLIDGYDEIG